MKTARKTRNVWKTALRYVLPDDLKELRRLARAHRYEDYRRAEKGEPERNLAEAEASEFATALKQLIPPKRQEVSALIQLGDPAFGATEADWTTCLRRAEGRDWQELFRRAALDEHLVHGARKLGLSLEEGGDREKGPWVTQDAEVNREWLHPEPLRFFLQCDSEGEWFVVDRRSDFRVAGPARTRAAVIREFYKDHSRPVPTGEKLPSPKKAQYQ